MGLPAGAEGVGASGVSRSTFTMSFTSSWILRNSRSPRPSWRDSSGRRCGPTTSNAMMRITRSSGVPMFSIERSEPGSFPAPSYPWHLGTAGTAGAAQAVRMFRGPGPLASDLLGDRAHLSLEAPSRPSQDQHVTTQREDEGEQRQGADGAQNDPHDEPRGHLRRCYTGASPQGEGSVAAVREEVADVRVVLE